MRLFIAEKPELARAIASAIDGQEHKYNGYIIKGNNYVTWALGHILQKCEPESYNANYKKWNLATLPFDIYKAKDFKYEPISRAKEQLKVILSLIKDSKITEIVHCGDADDEGQILIDEIISYSKTNKAIKRCLINDLTPKAIQKEIQNMQDNKEFFGISQKGYARSYADWIVGLNLTRAYSIVYGDGKNPISVGRVQTPILALVVARELENKNHKSMDYYVLSASFNNQKVNIEANLKIDEKIESKEEADKIYSDCINQTAILELKSENKKEYPPLPYNLLDLQAELAKDGYKPDEVLKITQELRENYKCISYNRSDCNYIPTTIYEERENILECLKSNFVRENIGQNNVVLNIKSKAFDDSKITAHYGIIPLAIKIDISHMTESQRHIYTLITKRFLMQFYKECEYIEHSLTFITGEHKWTKTIKEIKDYGYKKYFQATKEDTEQEEYFSIDVNNLDGEFIANNINIKPQKTKPKPRYTMATLLKDLNSVAKYVKDEKIKKLLLSKDKDKKGEKGGIGTPATRSNHINTLIQRGYIKVSKDKKQTIGVTEKGFKLIETLPTFLTTPELTALWSEQQEQIEIGELGLDDFLESVKQQVENEINALKLIKKENTKMETSEYKCPKCNKGYMILRKGTYGEFFACNNYDSNTRQGCKHTMKVGQNGEPIEKNMLNLTEHECPQCKSKLVKREGISKKTNKPYTIFGCTSYPKCEFSVFADENGNPKF